MKKIILIAAALITVSIGCIAQTTTKKEAIKELLSAMHQDSLMVKTMQAMSLAMANSYKRPGQNDQSLDSTMEKMMAKSAEGTKAMITKMINEDMVDVYDKYFTLQEIQDFTGFYKSKSGQQLLNKMPDITKDLMTIMSAKYLPAIQQSMMEAAKTN